uniref:Dense granule protein 3 n=1 Tax=Toxoplasma gondii TaxID=5811 RepID=I7BEL9_TOXGO|nr:dense granule protein 3 [Toxoplasma gondii]
MDRTICPFFIQSFTMSTALKRLIPFLVPFVVFLVAAALGGLAADQPENHQALAEPVTGVGEAGVSPVNEAGESYSSATSGVQEATAPGAVLLDAIDAESDKVDNQAEGGERMKKVEEELSLLRRELYDRTDRPGLKRAVILSLATIAAIGGRRVSRTLRDNIPGYYIAINAILAAYYIRKVLTYRRRVMTKRQPFMSSVKNFFRRKPKDEGAGVDKASKKQT